MIEALHVTKTYSSKHTPALDDLTLTVEKGEFVFVVGSSGSGKSTLLRLIIREERPTSGHLEVAGFELDRLRHARVPQLRRQIGTVFQDFRLLPSKTVEENVAFALRVIGGNDRQIRHAVPEVLELVGLRGKGKRMPHELSGGEQQRVALARAVVNRPPLLLADEPTGNLDPATSLEIVSLLERIHSAGTTVLMATHDSSIVDALGKRVVELDRGVLIRDEEQGRYIPRARSATGDRQQRALSVLPGPTASVYGRHSHRPTVQQRAAASATAASGRARALRRSEADGADREQRPAAGVSANPANPPTTSRPGDDAALVGTSTWDRQTVGLSVPATSTWRPLDKKLPKPSDGPPTDGGRPVAGRRGTVGQVTSTPAAADEVKPAPAASAWSRSATRQGHPGSSWGS